MKILITGGAGFIGSNLVEKLLADNQIYVVDNLSTGTYENLKEFENNENFKFYNMDITNNKIISFIRENSFDIIYNFACPASPQYYLEFPIETWESSVLGVRNLLKAIEGTKVKLFHSSTSEVYGDALENPQTEDYWGNVNSIGVRACYDEGKRAAEALIYDYIRKYDVDVRVARIFNTYGPKMRKEDGRIISNFVNQALFNENITIYGEGKQTRSFCYIDDTLDFILKPMSFDKKIPFPINVGNPVEISVLDVANIIKNTVNTKSSIVFMDAMKDDPQKRKPNINKAKEILNWEPKIDFNIGLEKTIKYFAGRK